MKSPFEFSPEATDTVNRLARKMGTNKSEVVRKALNLLSYIEDQPDKASKILVLDVNG